MKELYMHHDADEYSRVKKIVFSFSVINDAIRVVHEAIKEEIASYLSKVYSGEYKNITFSDTDEAIVISLWTKAKSSLLQRRVVGRTSVRTKVNSLEEDIIKEFEKTLYKPEEDMGFPND